MSRYRAIFSLVLLMSGASEASAQADTAESASPAVSESRQNRLVEEIIVTAQKREENLQEVPISVTAFSVDKLDALGVESAQDLGRITPGLTISGMAGYSLIFLRGVGTDAFLPAADQSVPIYIDGVNLLASQNTTDTLGRIARVEVLKGPQGTLFGRNATGGAISIVTADPDPTALLTDLKSEFGRDSEFNNQVFVNIPLVDQRLATTVSAYYNSHDSYYRNYGTGDVMDEYSKGYRVKLLWRPIDTLDFSLSYSNQQASTGGSLQQENTRPAPVLAVLIPADPQADRKFAHDLVGGTQTNSRLAAANIDWQLPWFDLKLIGSDQQLKLPFTQYDFDGSQEPLASFYSRDQFGKQKTAELQVLSNADSPFSEHFEWVAGLYYLEGSGGFPNLFIDVARGLLTALPAVVLPGQDANVPLFNALSDTIDSTLVALGQQPLSNGPLSLVSGGVLDTKSLSGFAQGTLTMASDFHLTLGARIQREERSLSQSRLGVRALSDQQITLASFDNVDDQKATQLSPKANLKWNFSDSANVYVNWARGFKSPTINTVNFFSPPDAVQEERITSYEIGVKSDLLGGDVRLNAAAFYSKIHNLLTSTVALASGGVVRFDNAGAAEIKGLEADVVWVPMPALNPGLAVTAAGSYLDSEYTDYPDGRGFDEATGVAFGPGLAPLPARDFTGNRIVRTPKVSYTIAANQSFPVGPGTVEIGIDTYYNDGFYFYPQNDKYLAQPSYQLWNARVSYLYDPWGLQATVFGENITGEDYFSSVFAVDTGRFQTLADPRIVGLRLSWSF